MKRLSTPARIFLSFALVLVTFGGVLTVSVYRHEQSARTFQVLHAGYLPLAITVANVRANQQVLMAHLDRFGEERESTAGQFLTIQRRTRPAQLHRAIHELERTERLAPPNSDRDALSEIRENLEAIERAYRDVAPHYNELYRAIERDDPDIKQVLDRVKGHETEIALKVRRAWSRLQELMSAIGTNAAEAERSSAIFLGILAGCALLLGVAVTYWTRRILKPLPQLQERVARVAAGDLTSHRLTPARDDELGQLTREFENMVDAIIVRNESLREAADTERKLQQKLLHSERLATIGRMAAHVTHEIRNPLSSIGLNVEMLEDELPRDGEARGLVQAIQREIDRLTGLTEQYLRAARTPELTLEPADLGAVIAGVATFVRPEMTSSGCNLVVLAADVLPPVSLDEAQMRQALLNLLRNAREAMPGGGTVRLTVDMRANEVVVGVEDEGPGIPAENRERIFDVFYTTKTEGTGLGLPLTQQIVVAHGGLIRCLDRAEGGTRFELSFPIAGPETSIHRH